MIAPVNNEPRKSADSPLAKHVLRRLPRGWMFSPDDLQWLNYCDSFLTEEPTNATVLAATVAACKANPSGHIDPFEMLIEAGVCDPNCEPRP